MANDIDKTSPHYKGEFGSIYEVNQKYPNGGVAGDYVEIDGWAHYWNADRGTWCVNAQRDSYWDELITGIIEKFKLFKGAMYMGVAGVSTVPEKIAGVKMYYFANAAGTYSGFGGLQLAQGINVLYTDNGTSWTATSLLEVSQELGVSTEKVMSQKAVDNELGKKADKAAMDVELGKKANKADMDTALGKKANKADMDVELGKKANTDDVNTKFTEEKNRVNGELEKKFDKTSILQESGDDENSVMSQKATTTAIADETTRATAAENKFLPLISEDVCKLENYKTVCTGISPMTYSDSAFGNLGDSFTILIKFNPSSPQSQAGFKNTLISKGDYDTDGWAIKTKEDENIGKLYLCVNGVYYPIYDNILHTLSNYNIEIAIVSGRTTRVYLYGKEVITLDNVATHSSSALTVGGNSDRYYFNYLIYLSFSYYERDRLSIMNEFSLLYRDFIRKSIEATFVASPLSLNDYGYSTGERFALVSSRKIITKTFNMLYVPQGYIYGMQLFDGFRNMRLENFNFIISEVPNALSEVSVFSKIFDVSEYDGIEIHNLSLPKVSTPCIVFLSEDNTIINYVWMNCVKHTYEGTYSGYVDSYSVDFPIGTKKICIPIRYDTYFKLYKNSKIVEAKELTAKNHRIYDRTPIILFDSARLINGTFIAYYNADSKWMPVTKNGETLTIASEFLDGFGLYKVCNAVYKDSEDNLGIIHVFKDNSGVLNILDPEDCPDNIAAITTHAYGGSGEMHLSSNASKAVGQALADATNDTLNYIVGGIAGYAQCKSYILKNPNSYSWNNSNIVTDPVGNAVFSTYHANMVYAGMYITGAWGVNQNQYNTTYKSDAEGVIASFSHIARYSRGYYEISAVSPRYSITTGKYLTTAKVVCTVKNNGRIIDSFEVSDWRADRRCVFIDERNTSEYILNVNKLAGDTNYSLQSAINAAIRRIHPETILVFKQNNEYVCYVYNGDNDDTDAYKDIKCWSLFEWGKVEIIFEQEGEGISELYVNTIVR